VLQVFAISLFLYITCKSIRELILFTNCVYCILSAYSDNRLVVNHLFIYILQNFVITISEICGIETSNNYASIIHLKN
jgi:hypothetical protein